MKRKVLFIMYNLEIGGAEKSLISILNNLNYEDFEVALFLYEHKGELIEQLPKEVTLLKELKIYKALCEGIKTNLKRGYIFLTIIKILSKLFTRVRKLPLAYDEYLYILGEKYLPSLKGEYDVAVSNIWPHNLVVNKVEAKKKLGWIHTDYAEMPIDYALDKRVLMKLDNIIAVSYQCKLSLERIYPDFKNKIKVIENIVDKELIKSLGEEDIKEEVEFKEGELRLLTVARLHQEKGVDRAIGAAARLKAEGRIFKWYIIGYGMEEKVLKERVKAENLENTVIFLGKKLNPYPYYKKCHIYIQPSRFEGKAITITEAKIFNKPIITTNYFSAKDQVHHGKNGLIVENSEEGIYKGLKELMDNEELVEKFKRALALEDFDNVGEIKQLINIL